MAFVAAPKGDLSALSGRPREALGVPFGCSGSSSVCSFRAPIGLHGQPVEVALGVHKEVPKGYLG